MKKYLIILMVLVSCNEHSDTERKLIKENDKTQPEYRINDFILDKQVPNCIKEIYAMKLDPNANDSCALLLIDSIKSKDSVRQPFYFLTLTRTFEKADASYSEAVCNFSMEYVRQNTEDFLNQFIANKNLNNNDMKLWANNVMMELIDFANEDANKEVKSYIDNLKLKSNGFSEERKKKLQEFITMMNNYCP